MDIRQRLRRGDVRLASPANRGVWIYASTTLFFCSRCRPQTSHVPQMMNAPSSSVD